jgi:hypothetical protein
MIGNILNYQLCIELQNIIIPMSLGFYIIKKNFTFLLAAELGIVGDLAVILIRIFRK